ncbi:hypothetical protein L2E82_07389 [Cichorium intybus]|uniref:Uncharacterized protein n=1 Tax=Cichorium intybus TaxID=13427 RepID=A0ACB9G5A1_CICIN|nr:hypothetical protein L2E82_07389 [Cichorium intybus]
MDAVFVKDIRMDNEVLKKSITPIQDCACQQRHWNGDACHLLTAFNHSLFPPSNACLLSSQPNQLPLFPKTPMLICPFPNSSYRSAFVFIATSLGIHATQVHVLEQRNSDAVGKRITCMEDPESEWAIQEYSPSKEGETTMVRWILNKGYSIGKKMVVTGIVISSAPMVLPPLVVFSAMGVAFSVPFGLVLASYACTNTLMNKLLPTPPTPASPLLLEYYADEDEEGVDSKFDLDEGGDDYKQTEAGLLYTYGYEDDELRKENVTQEEEEERIWETEEGTESPDGYEQQVEALTTNVHEDVDEKGYSTDDEEKEGEMEGLVGEMEENLDENEDEKEKEDQDDVLQREHDIEVEEREQMEDINQGIEMRLGVDMAGDDHKQTREVSTTNSSGLDEQGYEGDDDSLQEERKDETEEIVKGSTGLLEKIRDEGKVDDTVGDESALNGVFEEGKDVEMKEPVTVVEIETQKLVEDGSKNEETVGEMHRVVILAEGNEENNFNSREVEELDLVAREVVGDTRKEESDPKVMRENMGANDGSEDAIVKTKKDHLIHSNDDAREIGDESGLDLFDERNTGMNIEILEGGDEVKENTVDDNVDVMALPGFRHAPLDSYHTKVTSKTDRKKPSREDVLEDEKIWEKIGAMRAIVGYKAPSQPTCIEELKALYVFTGVEPPTTFKGDSDRGEVNAKLKFLMSIVGVK